MPIDSISGSSATSYLYPTTTTSNAYTAPSSTDSTAATNGAGKFANAIAQALTQVGATGTSASATTSTTATSGSSSSQTPQQAEAAFAQSLFAALQGQSGTSSSGAAQGSGGHHHHHGGGHGGGGGKIASALDSLAQSLTSSSTTPAGAVGSTPAASPAVSALQTSFNNLLAANGQSANSTSLPQFLQTLASNLQGSSNSGTLVSTTV